MVRRVVANFEMGGGIQNNEKVAHEAARCTYDVNLLLCGCSRETELQHGLPCGLGQKLRRNLPRSVLTLFSTNV